MEKIPEWQYPLYEESDEEAYKLLEKIGKSREFPQLVGSDKEINQFLKLLIASQKMEEWRKFQDLVLEELEKDKINVSAVLEKGQEIEIPEGNVDSWAIFIQDKRICELIDKFRDSKIEFQGSEEEKSEFIVRFLLSQLLMGWRAPLMAVLVNCLEKERPKVSELNSLLSNWDYSDIF